MEIQSTYLIIDEKNSKISLTDEHNPFADMILSKKNLERCIKLCEMDTITFLSVSDNIADNHVFVNLLSELKQISTSRPMILPPVLKSFFMYDSINTGGVILKFTGTEDDIQEDLCDYINLNYSINDDEMPDYIVRATNNRVFELSVDLTEWDVDCEICTHVIYRDLTEDYQYTFDEYCSKFLSHLNIFI